MRDNRSVPPMTVVPVLVYPDVRAAVTFLSAAFGFVERTRIGDGHRAQLAIGTDGAVIVADDGGERCPPEPGVVTHIVRVRVADVDAAFAVQTLLLAASDRAIGAAFLGNFRGEDALKAEL